MKHLVLSILLMVFSLSVFAQTPIYGIEGWGAATVGGQGGRIIRVTNLNATGVGSLKDAIAQTGSRIIVFEVGGVIDLDGKTIYVKNPNVTIAGQTAPSPGISLINGGINFQTHDVIMQHIRVRVGAATQTTGWEKDGISTSSGHHIVIDHCSSAWATDENCSASGPRFEGANPEEWRANTSHDMTISNCLIAEGLSNATHSKGEHSKGSLIHDNVTNIAILKNIYSCNKDRNPLFKGGTRAVVVNNFIYNAGNAAIKYGLDENEWAGHDWLEGHLSVVGNLLQYGSDTRDIPLVKANVGPCKIYLEDNVAKNLTGGSAKIYTGDSNNLTTERPIWNENIDIVKSSDLKEYLMNQVGARGWDRDAVDVRVLNNVDQIEGKIIDYETEVGGFPVLSNTAELFVEEDWNLMHMIHKSDLISVQVDKQSFLINDVVQVSCNTTSFSGDIEYLELLVNGEAFARDAEFPFQWEYSQENTGDVVLQIIVKENNGRLSISDSQTVSVVESLGVHNLNKGTLEVQITPIPFSNFINISLNESVSGDVTVEVRNMLGQCLIEEFFDLPSANQHVITITTTDLSSGWYCVILKNKGVQVVNTQLVLKK